MPALTFAPPAQTAPFAIPAREIELTRRFANVRLGFTTQGPQLAWPAAATA